MIGDYMKIGIVIQVNYYQAMMSHRVGLRRDSQSTSGPPLSPMREEGESSQARENEALSESI